jgi:hypothetical protein
MQGIVLILAILGSGMAHGHEIVRSSQVLDTAGVCGDDAKAFADGFYKTTGLRLLTWNVSQDQYGNTCRVDFTYDSRGKGITEKYYYKYPTIDSCLAAKSRVAARFEKVMGLPAHYVDCERENGPGYIAKLTRYQKVTEKFLEGATGHDSSPYDFAIRALKQESRISDIYDVDGIHVFYLQANDGGPVVRFVFPLITDDTYLFSYALAVGEQDQPIGQQTELEAFLTESFGRPATAVATARDRNVLKYAVVVLTPTAEPKRWKSEVIPLSGGSCFDSKASIVEYYAKELGIQIRLAYCPSADSRSLKLFY